jgi:hypothetical protein
MLFINKLKKASHSAPWKHSGAFPARNYCDIDDKYIASPRVDWSTDDVINWARQLRDVIEDDLDVLRKERINGEALLRISQPDLERLGMKYGPASKIIASLKPESSLDLFQICQKFPGYRSDFSSPRKVFSLSSYVFNHPYGREEAMTKALDLIHKRWNAPEPVDDVERRLTNRLVGLMCAPGGGKTFFLDLIKNAWREEYQIFNKHPEFRDWLASIIYLPVSFNGATPYSDSGASYKVEFAVRLFYAYSFQSLDTKTFDQVRSNVLEVLSTLSDPVDFVQSLIYNNEVKLGNSHPCFFILLDEIGKVSSENPKNPELLASKFGSLLDYSKYGYYDGIITTLDETTLKNAAQSGSLRDIQWIALSPPGADLAVKIFTAFFQESEDPQIKNQSTNKFLLHIIYLASNHWRSLEVIAKLLKQGKISDALDYANMIDLVLANLPGKAQLSGIDGEKYIFDTVQASERAFDAYLLCGTTFQKAISVGYYVNTHDSVTSSAIPLMSCLMIAHWAKQYFSENHLARLLNNLFRVDATRPIPYTYEEFHATWEAIRYYVFVQYLNLKETKSQNRTSLKICDLYNKLGQKGEVEDRQVFIEKEVVISTEFKEISLLLNAVLTPEGKLKDRKALSKLFLLGVRSEGCDSLSFHEAEDGDIVVRVLSAKFGESDQAQQDFSEISDGYEKIHKVFSKYPSLEDRIYFIVHSWRLPTHHRKIPKNTIILTKDHLIHLYSSFNQRPQLGGPEKLSINME